MAHQPTARLSASPPLFENRFLDFFSRIHPAVPALIFGPLIVALLVLGERDGQGGLELVGLACAGLVLARWMAADEREAVRSDRRLDRLAAAEGT